MQPEPEPERKNSLSEKKPSSPNQNGDTNNAPTDVPGDIFSLLIL